MSISILAAMFKFCNSGKDWRKWLDLNLATVAYLKELTVKVIHRICGKVC